MATDKSEATEFKATWCEVILPTPLQKLEKDYRDKAKAASAALEVLAKELRAKLESRHRDEIDEDGMEIAISFRFGKISYAIVPASEKKTSKTAVKLD